MRVAAFEQAEHHAQVVVVVEVRRHRAACLAAELRAERRCIDEQLNGIGHRRRVFRRDEQAVVVVLHDLDLVRGLCPEVLLLAGEPVAWGPAAEVLTAENRLRARLLAEARGAAPRRAA